jgi:MoaA/NifB/PqqE/SkfB family radical SAM enzyme
MIGKCTGNSRLLHPAILHLTVTNRCDLKCQICNIWKERPRIDTSSEVIEKLIGSRYFKDFQIIEFGGGEPFLVDLVELTQKFNHSGLKMILVTTNGMSPDRILDQVMGILGLPGLSLIMNVSIDGVRETHDRLRGVPGSYDRATETLRRLAELADDRTNLKVGAKLTIQQDNYREIWPTYLMAKEIGVEFTAKPAAVFGSLHNQEMDFDLTAEQVEEITGLLNRIDEDQAGDLNREKTNLFGRLYFFSNIIFNRVQLKYLRENLLEKRFKQVIPCYSTFFSVMVHVDGGVYCCPTLMKKVGDLALESFDEIWQGEKMSAIRRFIHEGKCSCFSQCDQMPSVVVKYKWRLGADLVKSYLRRG